MRIFLLAAALGLAACSPPAAAPKQDAAPPGAAQAAVSVNGVPSGVYTTDKAHSSLLVRLNHLSYSHFTARFETWNAQLQLDPAHPEAAGLNVNIDPRSISSDNPPAGFLNIMRGPDFLDAAHFNTISFHATGIERTGANTARIIGNLTLHGVTKPISLDATFNGGYGGMQLDPHARIGFSAHGTFKRSDFGMGYGVPPPGSNMGVGDDVEIVVETEMSGPAWTAPAQP